MTVAVEELGRAKYALLTTFRRDGRPVPTPVWIVRIGDQLGVHTVASFGKVKRLRRTPIATLATCDIRGNHPGPAYLCRGEIVEGAGEAEIRREIARKYGLIGRLTSLGSRIRRGRRGNVGIRLTVPRELHVTLPTS